MTAMNSVLARKLGLPSADAAASPKVASPLRMVRRALGRAADQALGLSASVDTFEEDRCEVEDLVQQGDDSWVILGIRDAGHPGLSGVFLVDPQVRSALVDVQTTGLLMPPDTPPRKVTKTDAALSMPFASTLMEQMHDVGLGGGDVQLTGYDLGPIDDMRTAGLVMIQGEYVRWRLKVHLGGGDLSGEIVLALRLITKPNDTGTATSVSGWKAAFQASLGQAKTQMDAELCTMPMTFDEIDGLEVGQVLPLAGTTVGSVTLTGANGERLASARLGQVAGKRAVRIMAQTVLMEEGVPLASVKPPEASSDTMTQTTKAKDTP